MSNELTKAITMLVSKRNVNPKECWPGFFRILPIYLTHFRGERSAMMQWTAPPQAPKRRAWDALTRALGLNGVSAGQRWTAPAGVPALGGVVEHVEHIEHGGQGPRNALPRLDTPGPGAAARPRARATTTFPPAHMAPRNIITM